MIENMYFHYFPYFYMFLNQFLKSWVSQPCFLSFSTQNHAESSGNYLEELFFDPKYAKLNQHIQFLNAILRKKRFGPPDNIL